VCNTERNKRRGAKNWARIGFRACFAREKVLARCNAARGKKFQKVEIRRLAIAGGGKSDKKQMAGRGGGTCKTEAKVEESSDGSSKKTSRRTILIFRCIDGCFSKVAQPGIREGLTGTREG